MSKYLSDTSSDSTLYVRTNTGRGLNLRDLPSLEGNIITSFKMCIRDRRMIWARRPSSPSPRAGAPRA